MARVGHSLRERLDKSQAVIRLPQQQHARIRSQPLVFPPNLDGTIESGLEQPLLCFTHDVNPFSGSGATLRCRFLREKLSIRSLRSNGVLNNVGSIICERTPCTASINAPRFISIPQRL